MAQQPLRQVTLPAKGVDDTVGALGHGVDRQIAPLQVLFQRDIW